MHLLYLSLRAVDNLHSGMLRCLQRAAVALFRANPSGLVPTASRRTCLTLTANSPAAPPARACSSYSPPRWLST